MKTWIYLDDERTPSYNFFQDVDEGDDEDFEVYTVRSGKQFMKIIEEVNPTALVLIMTLEARGILAKAIKS